MHPDYGRAHYALRQGQGQTHADLRRQEHAAAVRDDRVNRKHGPRWWKLNWTTLSPRDVTSDARQGRSSWTIIISASRPN